MTAAVASPSAVAQLADGGERERVRRGGGKKLSSIFSHRNVFLVRKKLRSSSLSATLTPATAYPASTSSRSSSTHLTSSCHADYDHCSTSNSRVSTSPLSPHSVWSDSDADEEDDIHELHSAAPMSDEEERRDVISPPSSCCSFSSSSSSSSGSSSSSFASSSSSTSLSPLPTLISPRSESRARRRMQPLSSKEVATEQKEAHATLPPPLPIVALPPLHPHALTQHAPLPLAASSPSLVGTPPTSYRQHQPRHTSPATVIHQASPPSAVFSSPVRGHKHNRSHSASNQFVLLQGGANSQSPSARSPTTHHSVYASPVQTSPFPSPLPSPNIHPAPFSPHFHHSQHSPHQHHHSLHPRHHHYQQQQQQHFRQPPPSPLLFSAAGRSPSFHPSSAGYPISPFLFLSQQHQSQSSPPSPTLSHSASMQPPTSPTVPANVDGPIPGACVTSQSVFHPASMSSHAAVSSQLASSFHHSSSTARPVLSRAASMLDTSRASSTGSLIHPHPRRSSLLDLVALENSHGKTSKPRSVSSAANYPTFHRNKHALAVSEHDTSSYPSHSEVQRLLATPLAALLGLTESEPSRSHVPKAVARCAEIRNSPSVAVATRSLIAQNSSCTVEHTADAVASSSVAALSPLCLHRELPSSVPSSPASFASIAAALPRRLSISSAASPVLGAAHERERRLSSASSSSSVLPSPVVNPTPASPTLASPTLALRAVPSASHTSFAASAAAACDPSSTGPPLFTASSRQTSQTKSVAAAHEAAADREWQTQKSNQKKHRARDAIQPDTATDGTATSASSVSSGRTSAVAEQVSLEAGCMVLATAVEDGEELSPTGVGSATVVQLTRAETVAAPVQPPPSPMIASAALDELVATAAVESNKPQLDKKPRSARPNRARSTSNGALPPVVADTLTATTASSPPAVRSSLATSSLSIRLSLLAFHSNFLSTISALISTVTAAAIQQWATVCAFYHSLFASSSSRRRFVSRLRSLSHTTQQQQHEQTTPQPAKARHGHWLRYRHHPLLERQRLTKECQPAGVAAAHEERELLMPRGLVLSMVLCCLFLGVVILTVTFHREQSSVSADVDVKVAA